MTDELNNTEFKILKCIRRVSKGTGAINLSTEEIAGMAGVSQQSASRTVISLSRMGYITRVPEHRRQNIALTPKGISYLKEQLADLTSLMGVLEFLEISGFVESGLGEGKYYVSRKNYIIQFQQKLGFIPFLGTLNVRLKQNQEANELILRNSPGIYIEGFKTEERTFGPVKAFRSSINGVEGAVIMPERTVHINTIEIISREYLREKLKLKDGDEITVKVLLKSE
ncbi:MAG: DUF120 domain-containing protein [Candidatus Thermoplasmatota archaeon]|nr:DUF120 domain-containing protein [Candidatus Thermoplasmatota archaeon]MCL5730974.1 DUF120 domain-containing protein [Candidatus Thermoplasmatota archaeon]